MRNLDEYNSKRNFKKTKEPFGKVYKLKNKRLKFVVQHHIATKDHYDLRLEYEGVYISFAIPKGPSFNAKDKRLAIRVEDHPLTYGNFEGVIPKCQYGGGTVMLWDKGYWHLEQEGKPDFKQGPIKFSLKGQRLKGKWVLIKFKENNWILMKEKDKYTSTKSINTFKTSIKTNRTMVEIANNKIKLTKTKLSHPVITNPKKIIFNKEKITKMDIVEYYELVSKRMMPFLDNRLISALRAPKGINSEIFFMKHLNSQSTNIGKKQVKSKNGEKKDYFYLKNPMGILEEVQMNSYEFHIWGSKQNSIKHPDILVFDLDPDENLSISKVREGVKDLKLILDSFQLKSFLKTSGGKGYHIYVPLNLPSWKRCEQIALDIANLMVMQAPDKYTTKMSKKDRQGKIFIDYLRNKMGSTSVCPYSLRLKNTATVSCPIYWKELDTINPDDITIKNIKDRLKKKEPWQNFFD